MYFDTHAHYDDRRFNADRGAVLDRLQQQGDTLVLNAGCDLTSSRMSIELAEAYPFIYASVGFHPHDS
ncbi:MAG: TatD family hydrolase, partial [Oscillospiraceae bacterium]|nr:TatD family hydrolase [Oscillospiraceae bacterium]